MIGVLRLCSVFEPPPGLSGRDAARFDGIGGMQTHTGELSRALDARGVAQRVVTAWRPGAPRVTPFGARACVARVGVPVPVLRQCWAPPAAVLALRWAADADLVHAHLGEDLAVLPIALAAARRHALPLVVTVHTSVAHTLAVHGARSAVVKAVGGWWERRVEPAADAVLALTPRLAGVLTEQGVDAGRVHVVPSGVRPQLFDGARPLPPEFAARLAAVPRPRIGYVGRLHPQKSVDVVVRALPLLDADAHLVVAGEGPDRPKLERLVDELGLRSRVTFLGLVPHDDVPALLREVDVAVLPSRYEELGTAIVEAMACGVPVVASRTGGIPDVVRDGVNGLLAEPGDVPATAAALRRVLADPHLRRRLGECGRRSAQDHRWDVLAERVHDVYTSVLEGSRVRPSV
ncbi:MAG TPA: glycosyltransferase family 4 protein [Kineosporiaceae bacterium]|nr:glycosyltransferase family 4 protein [Kineosporiaceae bacterium]